MTPVPASSVLSPTARFAALDAAEQTVADIVVIGGGITGVGTALDAAARGLDVVLVERDDLATGTSSRSSKLVHGGLRYLEHLDLALVFEALHERSAMLRDVAPGLVTPVPFVIPITGARHRRAYFGAGVALYDLLASWGGGNPLPRHRHLGRRRVRALLPDLDPTVVRGGIAFWDAQLDDARHTMLVARTAAAHGARICTGTEVVSIELDTSSSSTVHRVHVRDTDTGRERTLRTRCVVNATGVWTTRVDELAGAAATAPALEVRASKGVHLVVPRERLRLGAGLVLRTEKSVLFVIPWLGHWLIGTTDTPHDGDPGDVTVTDHDVAYLLERVNTVLARPLTVDDVTGSFAGLRPLVPAATQMRTGHGGATPSRLLRRRRTVDRAADTTTISREHVVRRPAPGLVTIAGGKYTTYRRMAADAVDAALGSLPDTHDRQGRRSAPPSRTRHLPLVGAHPTSIDTDGLRRAGLDDAAWSALVVRHGPLVDELAELLARHPALARPLQTAPDLLAVEVVHAVTHEGARHLDDVLARRTRLAILDAAAAAAAAPEVAALMAPHLGWDHATIAAELARVAHAGRDRHGTPATGGTGAARR